MPHIVLLGDSIFDNAGYLASGPDVATQLRGLMPDGWRVTLAAVDGGVANDVRRQAGWLGSDVSHLVVSVGGNDALGYSNIVDARSSSIGEGLSRLSDIRASFQADYEAMLDTLGSRRLPTAVCTIYDVRYAEPRGSIANMALNHFNDVITRGAFRRDLTLIDLRLICDEEDDFANPIEPSVQGGAKIAPAIRRFALGDHAGDAGRSSVISRPV